MKKFVIKFSILLIIVVVIGGLFVPLMKDTNYGLDLKGGFEVLYKISPLEGDKITQQMVTSTYKTISRRVDALGVSEPEISIEGNDRIRVKLAGVTNKDEARTILSKAASLSFRDTNDNLLMTSSVLKGGNAKVTTDEKGAPAVMLPIKDVDKFYDVTNMVKDFVDNRIVIWLDYVEGEDSFVNEESVCGSLSNSKCLSAATVSQAFASDVIIQGNFTKEEVTTLVELINSGSLPTKLTELSSKTVSASFGENSLNKMFFAGIVGICLIFAIMIGIYRFAGLIASLGLIIYTFLVFLIFWVFGGVLTLPGIASLLLGIGMAVDANVLSFERIKEELKVGSSLKEAFKVGYTNSFSSIIDANITTLIVAIILFILGESSVKGFATMLIISIFATIFVMVFVIKWLLKVFVKTGFFDKHSKAFINTKKDNHNKESIFTKFDYLKNRKLFFGTSLGILIIGTIFTFILGLNLSVDFKGGTDFTITSTQKLEEKNAVNDFANLGYDNIALESVDENTIYVKLPQNLEKDEIAAITNHFESKYNGAVESGTVSTIVKRELVKNAIISLLLAIIGIIIYVSIRFNFCFSVSAIIALLHDALFVVAMFSILRLQIDTVFIAAVLTIIGYSINDTVVVFDRIREERKNNPKIEVYKTINRSLGVTMTRSIYTGLTVLIMIISLLLFGTYDIFNFNMAMLFGLITGSYSSVFIASALWYELIKNDKDKDITKNVIRDELEELNIKGINS